MTNEDQEQPVHSHSLIWIYTVCKWITFQHECSKAPTFTFQYVSKCPPCVPVRQNGFANWSLLTLVMNILLLSLSITLISTISILIYHAAVKKPLDSSLIVYAVHIFSIKYWCKLIRFLIMSNSHLHTN